VDLQAQIQIDGGRSWFEGGGSGLRFGEDDSALQLAQAGVELSYKLSPTWQAKTVLLAYTHHSEEITASEAFLHYRPVPTSQWRNEWRFGAFHLPISLENRGPLWTSPYSLNSSAINTWIGEELRTIGAEGRWSLPGQARNVDWDLSLYGAAFGLNDTAGMMLTWRGWAQHDRFAGLSSDYPLADLPQVGEGALFEDQISRFEPFVEADDRLGFYVGGDLAIGAKLGRNRALKLSYLYYDNQAKSTALRDGQYGWRTRFHHASAHWRLAGNFEILSQAMSGDTLMGAGPTTSIEADFWSAYLLFSKRFGAHRASLRWDRFEVEDLDQTPYDNNDEHGSSATLSYSYNWGKGWKASVNLTHWESDRPIRAMIPNQQRFLNTEQWQFSLRRYW
jgi:hypothetical protein